jgi:hypothetical protein
LLLGIVDLQGDTMNQAQSEAVKSAIGNAEDNLYRFKGQEDRMPGGKTGNGRPVAEVIADLERWIAELKEGM